MNKFLSLKKRENVRINHISVRSMRRKLIITLTYTKKLDVSVQQKLLLDKDANTLYEARLLHQTSVS
jgi:hypothetical protein